MPLTFLIYLSFRRRFSSRGICISGMDSRAAPEERRNRGRAALQRRVSRFFKMFGAAVSRAMFWKGHEFIDCPERSEGYQLLVFEPCHFEPASAREESAAQEWIPRNPGRTAQPW